MWPSFGSFNRVGRLTYVGIPKNKFLIQLVFCPVHLAADDAEQGLAIDEHLDPVLLDRLVKRTGLVDIFEMVRQAAAAPIPNANFDEFWLGLIQHHAKLLHSRGCEFHGCFSRSQRGARPHRFGLLLCGGDLCCRGRFNERRGRWRGRRLP